jgi:hypothetical protein
MDREEATVISTLVGPETELAVLGKRPVRRDKQGQATVDVDERRRST